MVYNYKENMLTENKIMEELLLSSVEIAELTNKRHDHVCRDIRKQLALLYPEDIKKSNPFINDDIITEIAMKGVSPNLGTPLKFPFQGVFVHPQNNQEYSCFMLPKREVLILVSGYSVELRAVIIDRLEYLENELKSKTQFKLPQTYREALLELAEKVGRIEILENKIEEDRPKVEFADNIASASNSISVGEFAKLIKDESIDIGQNKLFKWFRENGYLMDNNVPYQNYINAGYFEIIEQSYTTPYGKRVSLKTLITGKGQIYFTEKLRSEFSKKIEDKPAKPEPYIPF